MTPEELTRLVESGASSQLVEALACLSEKQRKELDETAHQLYQHPPADRDQARKRYDAVRLAVLGLCRSARVKSLFLFGPAGFTTQVVEVLSARRPSWAGKWLAHRLERDQSELSYQAIDELVARGVVQRPSGEGYYRLLANYQQRELALSDWLRQNRRVTEHELWQLFSIESTAFNSYFDEEKPPWPGYESWTTALVKLSDEGLLERDRLLDHGLAALGRDFKQNQLSGFRKFLERLKPTDDELAARQSGLRELLASPTSHVVNFGLTCLGRLGRYKRLEVEPLMTAVEPALSHSTKGTAMKALKLVARVGDPAPLAARALAHPSVDVQKLALDLVERSGRAAELLVGKIEFLAASLVPQARELAGQTRARAVSVELGPPPSEAREWQALPELERLEPIADVEELIDRVAAAMESVEDGEEVELLLDGIGRLGPSRPPDFELRTAALRVRLESQPASEVVRGLAASWSGLPSALRDLLLTWFTGKLHYTPHNSYYKPAPAGRFLEARVRAISQRLARGVVTPSLALPTHRGGWIEPRKLIGRAVELGHDFPREELMAAFLRLAPEGRDDALEAAAGLASTVGLLTRFALGGGYPPGPRDREFAPLWLAAARAREPHGDHAETLAALGVKAPGPDGFEAARPSWSIGLENSFPRLRVEFPEPPRQGVWGSLVGRLRTPLAPEQMPTAALFDSQVRGWETVDYTGVWLVRWLGLTFPIKPDGLYLEGIRAMLFRVDMDSSGMAPSFPFIEALAQPGRVWSELARLAFWVALVGKDADCRAVAVDLGLEAIESGRTHPVPLAATLVQADQAGWVKANRLAAGLEEIARASELAAVVVAECLDAYLARVAGLPRALHHLLELRLDLSTRLQRPPSDEARRRLSQLEGSGKAARLAASLAAV
ncbi:MAG: DUF6493 family protein [Vulcanimicrobiota bacterium]